MDTKQYTGNRNRICNYSKQPDYMAVAFDVHQPTFRHEMFKDYKGTRKPMMEELREQVPVIKELLQKMNIKLLLQSVSTTLNLNK